MNKFLQSTASSKARAAINMQYKKGSGLKGLPKTILTSAPLANPKDSGV